MNHKISLKNKDSLALPIAEACPGKIEIPTKKEQEALTKMKTIKERVRELKSNLNIIQEDDHEKTSVAISEAKKELTRLKVEWETWEAERKQAAKERMIFLGHEEPAGDLSSENG